MVSELHEKGDGDLRHKDGGQGPLRVVQFCDLQAGGIASLILSVCEQMDREKVNFDYLVYRNQEEFYDARAQKLGGRKLIADNTDAPNKMAKFLWKFYRVFRVIKREKARIVHVNVSTPYDCLAGMAARLAGVETVVLHAHNSRLRKTGVGHRLFQQICRLCIPLCGHYYFACSDLAARFMYGKRRQKNVVEIKNGIHTETFRFDESVRMEMRERYEIENALVFGTVGRLCEAKNQGFLLEVFAKIRQICPRARFLLIGQGEREAALLRQAKDLELNDCLIHIAATDRAQDYYCMMDAFLLPSLFEGLPVVGVEAQASGLACVFSDRITREVSLTDRAFFLSLERPASQWARFSVAAAKKGMKERGAYAARVREAGFDVAETAGRLQEFYLGL